MITIEMVEKLKNYGDISYEEAKTALEEANGNILDAIIILEKQGKIKPPEANHTEANNDQNYEYKYNYDKYGYKYEYKYDANKGVKFNTLIKKCLIWIRNIIRKGNRNKFDIFHKGEPVLSIPVSILVILFLCFFWIVFPLLIIGLFFDYRYLFNGPDLGNETVNNIVNSVADTAEEIKNKVNENDDQ